MMEIYNSIDSGSILDRMLYLDWRMTLADNDLIKVNRMCELAGVSVSYPLLDDDIVDYEIGRFDNSIKASKSEIRQLS